MICPKCGYRGELKCAQCGYQWPRYIEKLTDVKIATEMIFDGLLGAFDIALVVSADADLSSPIQAILRHDPSKRVIAVFPPKRRSKALASITNGQWVISRNLLAKCQFPYKVARSDGYMLERPVSWR